MNSLKDNALRSCQAFLESVGEFGTLEDYQKIETAMNTLRGIPE